VLLALIGVLAASQAVQPKDPCDSARTTLGARTCLGREVDVLERGLAVALDAARTRLGRAGPVDSAQRAWEAYRSAQCHASALEYAGGTEQSVAEIACWRTLTVQRVAEVRGMYRTGSR